MEDIEGTVKAFLSKASGNKCATCALHPDMSLKDDLAIDSFGAIEVMMEIEDKYAISVDNEALLNLRTVGDVIELVTNRLAAPKTA